MTTSVAAPIASPMDASWDNSAMDGYAVRAADTHEDGVFLAVNERIGAGGVAPAVTSGTATAIMIKAPMPEGADSEYLERTK